MTRSMLAPTIFLALCLLVAAPARPSAPELISYQGVLTLQNGVVVDDGTYTLRFRILDSPEPGQGQVKFEQELSVKTTNGLYNVILSSHDTQSLADAFDEPQRFMEVTILGAGPGGSDVTLLPRQRIASVPYALGTANAAEAEHAATATEAGHATTADSLMTAAGRVQGGGQVQCNENATQLLECDSWGTGTCGVAGSYCPDAGTCSAGVRFIPISGVKCWTSSNGWLSTCFTWVCYQ